MIRCWAGTVVKDDVFPETIPIYDDDGELVAVVNGSDPIGKSIVDLTVTAPELLRACKEAKYLISEMECKCQTNKWGMVFKCRRCFVLERLDVAIKQARGEK